MASSIFVFAVLLAIGALLTGNVFGAASTSGRWLVGKQRLRFIKLEHRRERIMRTFGLGLFALSVYAVVARLYGSRSVDWWAATLAWLFGLGIPVALWWVTRNAHGREISDDTGTEPIL